jgi:hypothetical protein
MRLRIGLLVFALLPATAMMGWTYPEHREITAKGIDTLEPRDRAALDALWAAARAGQVRLCESPAAGDQGPKPQCIDLAAWAAIAGDHSCSPEDLLVVVLQSDWILKVAAVTAHMESGLAKAKNEAERTNVRVVGDLGLERSDPEYSTRAGANNAHFLLPRSVDDPTEYAVQSLTPGSELNAMALYVLFHVAALQRMSHAGDAPEGAEARMAFALELFALHFLEDAFAAGHIAGSWGNAAERKGTHDYYNQNGLDAESWNGAYMILFGDGYARDADIERGGEAVRLSLVEFLAARRSDSEEARRVAVVTVQADVLGGKFDVCKSTKMPSWTATESVKPLLQEVVGRTPVPYRGPGYASLPRFRAEIGPFIGVASGAEALWSSTGFTNNSEGGVQGQLDVGVRLGLGLDALLGSNGDGLVFVEAAFVNQSRSSGGCPPCEKDPLVEQFVPGSPARSGLQFRLRLPFWLIPGDLILAAPVLAFTDPKALEKMAITAADGGLIPWQTRISTPIGDVQFVAGREVGVTLFGYGTKDAFLGVVGDPSNPEVVPLAVKSLQWDFPVVEYRPFREYGTRYTFATFVQLGFGFDKPISAVLVEQPGVPAPPLQTRYLAYLRIFFDGRRYF